MENLTQSHGDRGDRSIPVYPPPRSLGLRVGKTGHGGTALRSALRDYPLSFAPSVMSQPK
jgi:hypothetical protein